MLKLVSIERNYILPKSLFFLTEMLNKKVLVFIIAFFACSSILFQNVQLGAATTAEDRYEDNDSKETATHLELGTYTNLTLHDRSDKDYYQVNLIAGDSYEIFLNFSTTNYHFIEITSDSAPDFYQEEQSYFLRPTILLDNITISGAYTILIYNNYQLEYEFSIYHTLVEDRFEENNLRDTAAPIDLGIYENLSIHYSKDCDYYAINLSSQQNYEITVNFSGNIYYQLWYGDEIVYPKLFSGKFIFDLNQDGQYFIKFFLIEMFPLYYSFQIEATDKEATAVYAERLDDMQIKFMDKKTLTWIPKGKEESTEKRYAIIQDFIIIHQGLWDYNKPIQLNLFGYKNGVYRFDLVIISDTYSFVDTIIITYTAEAFTWLVYFLVIGASAIVFILMNREIRIRKSKYLIKKKTKNKGVKYITKHSRLLIGNERQEILDFSFLQEPQQFLDSVTELYIQCTHIHSFHHCPKFPNLINFKIIGNIRSFEGLPEILENLKSLSIRGDISSFAHFPHKLPNLSQMEVSESLEIQSLKGLPIILSNLEKLQIVDCGLTSLDGFPQEVPKLSKLYLVRNELTSLEGLPKEIPMLTELDGSNNHLEDLIGLPQNMSNLHVISFCSNQLTSFEGLPDDFPALEYFAVSENKLKDFKYFPANLPKLHELDLIDNQFSNFNDFPQNYLKFQIWMSNNPLQSLKGLNKLILTQSLPSLNESDLENFSAEAKAIINTRNISQIYEYFNGK